VAAQTFGPRRIRVLREEVSRKIAAGEVIDRPLSIVRELLDNSLDSGATQVDVYLEGGGVSRVRVVDNGSGMDREDLSLCWQPHATSKIQSADDLLTVTSLGFRGEALSSIAAVSRLQIVSALPDGPAYRLTAQGGRLLGVEPATGKPGTSVDVSELFFDFPARRKFLKGPSAESALCRTAFVDRALAHSAVAFRLFSDGELKLFLPAAGLAERVGACYASLGADARLLSAAEAQGSGFTVTVAAAEPGARRNDRRLVQVFVNRRRVSEYSLMQAAEHGYAGFIPGGWHPVVFVFVEVDPGLVDFNIHPAKKEARFRNLPDIHAAVVRAVRTRLGAAPRSQAAPGADLPGLPLPGGARPRGLRTGPPGPSGFPKQGPPPHGVHPRQWPSLPDATEQPLTGVEPGVPSTDAADGPLAGAPVRFLGQVFDVFLVFQQDRRLVFLDQHAAHERVIFERISAGSLEMQELLFPISFDAAEDEQERISGRLQDLEGLGIRVRRAGSRAFEISALSPTFTTLPEPDLVALLKGSEEQGGQWLRGIAAGAACRLALKEGDPVDPVTAVELYRQALALAVPRCPHGRPLWHELGRDELYRLVDRPVD
jgi:DNA mismatch repair protein MutL